MTTIHDQLHDAVADVHPDLDALTFSARRQGLAKRRLTRSLTAVGTAAAVGLIGVSGWALTGIGGSGQEPSQVAPATGPTAAPAPPSPELVRLTGRGTAALLSELVATHVRAGGTPSAFRGQGGMDLVDEEGNVVASAKDFPDTYAELTLRNREGTSMLGVNVQRLTPTLAEASCSATYAGTDCRVAQLENGDTLRTYVDDTDKPGTTQLVTEVISPGRDLRIVLGASAPTGSAQAVTRGEMRSIVTDPSWSFQVPADVAAAGEALDFTALDNAVVGRKVRAVPSSD